MARSTIKTAEIALVAATRKTVLEITADAARRLDASEYWVDFDGEDATAPPVVVEVLRKSATVTGAGSPPSPTKLDPADGTPAYTVKHNASAEGTDGDVLYRHEIHPTSGKHVIFPLGDEIKVALSGMLAIACTAPEAVNVIAGFGVKE